MRPGARVAAAIEVLDAILGGLAAEPALRRWAKGNRYAGSKDRAAIRDHVFDALRCKRSYAWLGGSETGRGLMLGALRAGGVDIGALFSGDSHAPALPADDEAGAPLADAPDAVRLDCPDWLMPLFQRGCADVQDTLGLLRSRAGVFLRVNMKRGTPEEAVAALTADGIVARAVPDVNTALQVTEGERLVASSSAYLDGLVELQDPASQLAVAALPLEDGMRVLDYCAGGGGKTLAMAARARLLIVAHDADPRRMSDLPERAARAGVDVTIHSPGGVQGAYDLVLVDAPCSGSGTWRRAPEAKWALTPSRLEQLALLQREILTEASAHVRPGGILAYMTCSVFEEEDGDQAAWLSERLGHAPFLERRLPVHPLHDGFYYAAWRMPA